MKKRQITPTSVNAFERFPHPEPIRVYKTTIHGQEVTVRVFEEEAKTLGKLKADWHE